MKNYYKIVHEAINNLDPQYTIEKWVFFKNDKIKTLEKEYKMKQIDVLNAEESLNIVKHDIEEDSWIGVSHEEEAMINLENNEKILKNMEKDIYEAVENVIFWQHI